MDKNKKRLIDYLQNDTPAYLLFKGLKLNPEDFITLEELINFEKKENTAKLLALRELGNSFIQKGIYVDEIKYSEAHGPKLTLLFKDVIKNSYNVTELCTPKHTHNVQEKYCYTITPEILEYLLESRNLHSSLDHLMIEKYKEELHFFRDELEKGTFYADYQVYDALNQFIVSVTNGVYMQDEIFDSFNITQNDGGQVSAEFIMDGDYSYKNIYNVQNHTYRTASTYAIPPNGNELPKKLYLHKPTLPTIIQEKINRG